MTQFFHILRELGRNLIRNPGTVLGSFLSLSLLLLLFNLFWVSAGTVEKYYADLLSQLRLELFVTEQANTAGLKNLEDLLSSSPAIRSFEFVSREKARTELSRLIGVDLLIGYDSANPLPRSYVLELTPEYLTSERIKEFADGLATQQSVAEVHYGREWLEKEELTQRLIWKVGLALGIVILLTALITTINSIRLNSRARARGFEQMKLLGAGTTFLAAPFIIEGFLLGGLSALCGWAVIWYAKDTVSFTQLELVLPPSEHIVAYCFLMALVGIVSGYLGIRRPLREV